MAKNKHYVVWKGLNPGIYDSWAECKSQVEGQEGAKYKSFESREEAVEAFDKGYTYYLKTVSSAKAVANLNPVIPVGKPINESIAVDAACSGNPGDMEYRGVYTATRQEIFHIGPLKKKKCKTLLERTPENEPIFDLIERAEKWLNENTYQTAISKWDTSEWGEIPADFGRK